MDIGARHDAIRAELCRPAPRGDSRRWNRRNDAPVRRLSGSRRLGSSHRRDRIATLRRPRDTSWSSAISASRPRPSRRTGCRLKSGCNSPPACVARARSSGDQLSLVRACLSGPAEASLKTYGFSHAHVVHCCPVDKQKGGGGSSLIGRPSISGSIACRQVYRFRLRSVGSGLQFRRFGRPALRPRPHERRRMPPRKKRAVRAFWFLFPSSAK
jgi:hypothetical protein